MAKIRLIKTQHDTQYLVNLDVSVNDLVVASTLDSNLLTIRNKEGKPTFAVSLGLVASMSPKGVVIPYQANENEKISFTVDTELSSDVIINAIGTQIEANLNTIETAIKKVLKKAEESKLEVIE